MKVKNVIKGHCSREEIDRLIIIDTKELQALFSGHPQNFIHPVDCMKDYAKEVSNREVIKSEVNCGCQLFVYI